MLMVQNLIVIPNCLNRRSYVQRHSIGGFELKLASGLLRGEQTQDSVDTNIALAGDSLLQSSRKALAPELLAMSSELSLMFL